MSKYFPCQICQQNSWKVLACRTFLKSDINTLDEFTKMIYRYMFETWFPGKSEIPFQNLYCNHCGFICFSPRSTEENTDIRRRSRRDENSIVGYAPDTDIEIAKKRSGLLFDYLNKHVDLNGVQKVLDFGGKDGNLLQEFLANGKDCFVVDYSPYYIPGVTKLGSTVYEINKDDKFDLIICNHVIEHVAEPRKVLKSLLAHLKESGILFIEVPMEIWKRPPLLTQQNPITHVNFFSPNSLKNLLIASGASVTKCHFIEYLYDSEKWNPGIRCIGRKEFSNAQCKNLIKPDSMDFLKPKIKTYFKYYFGNPRKFRSEIIKHLFFGNNK